MRAFTIFAIAVTITIQLAGCAVQGPIHPAGPGGPGSFSERIEFNLLLALFRSERGQDRLLHVHLSFPRSRLLFLRDESREKAGWQAEYEWSVIIRDRGGIQVGGGVYSSKVLLEGGQRPEDPAAMLRAHQQLSVPSGRYWVEVTVSDKNSVRQGKKIKEIETYTFWPDEPGLSQIEVLDPGTMTPSVSAGSSPLPAELHGREVLASTANPEGADAIAFLFEAYCLSEESEVAYRLLSGDGSEVCRRTRRLPACERLTVRDTLSTGRCADAEYTLEVVIEGVGARPLRQYCPVRIRRPLLAWGEDLEETLAQLSLYASEETVGIFRLLPPERRRAFLDSLWKAVDPTPSTDQNELKEEFLRRLRYADEQWRVGAHRGWEVDIGRIYIAYGEPDEVLEERMVRTAVGPLDEDRQVLARKWIYRQPPVTFVFEYTPERGWILLRDVSSPLPPDPKTGHFKPEMFREESTVDGIHARRCAGYR